MTQSISEQATLSILKGITVPPQPQIMADLHLETVQPDVSLDSIAELIGKDVGIAGSVIKVVNSPVFNVRSPITSIKQALSLLGIANVINIVNALAIKDNLSDASIVEMTRFWDNAMDVAMACAALSGSLGIAAPDEAYSLGLFHNAGIPLLMSRFSDYPKVLRQAYQEQQRPLTELENQAVGSNHSVVGYYVAKAWKLPDYLSEAIADHHKTDAIFADKIGCDRRKKNLLAVLKLAEHICRSHQVLGQVGQDYEFARIRKNLLIGIGISEYDFDDLRAQLLEMGLGG